VHDPALVGRLDDLGDALEERHELRKQHRPVIGQPALQREALHELHRDPQKPVVLLGAKRVDMRGVGVIEPRRQLRLAQEALDLDVVAAQPVVQHLDDGFTAKRWLLAAIHHAEPAFVESFAKHELSKFSPGKIVSVCHSRKTLAPAIRRLLVCATQSSIEHQSTNPTEASDRGSCAHIESHRVGDSAESRDVIESTS
jgi:hypothetical protein